MSKTIELLEQRQLRKGRPRFKAGDTVRVHFQVIEGQRRRIQVFEGIVIKRQGAGVRETFTVRKQSFGVGVERTFPLHSPKIEKIEVMQIGDVNRAKLYYLREKVGKKARVRAVQRRDKLSSVDAVEEADEEPEQAVEPAGEPSEEPVAEEPAATSRPPKPQTNRRRRPRCSRRRRAPRRDRRRARAGRRRPRPGKRLLSFDRRLGARFVAGADEAGRGSLAGPLVVAGVLLDYAALRDHRVRPLALLNDSKQLSAGRREELFRAIVACAERVAVRVISPRRDRPPRPPPLQPRRAARGARAS